MISAINIAAAMQIGGERERENPFARRRREWGMISAERREGARGIGHVVSVRPTHSQDVIATLLSLPPPPFPRVQRQPTPLERELLTTFR